HSLHLPHAHGPTLFPYTTLFRSGMQLYPEANRLDRAEALRRYTVGSAWFSGEEAQKGAVAPGQLADLAVLSDDYFAVPEEEIKGDRKSTRLNSSHVAISYAVFCL